ncbi:GntR family transcriptional regulator [Martelella alba]|uniref:GntR family transcriptional regulator n=1 Tax=Martelella alba TaxID=2590451 RepID=A0A506UCT3_9HYPH|nr:GntR family transcriptional regulator [Martelella alba]TPW30931.1 GntR family transcriptional regulator [Martelella alba]
MAEKLKIGSLEPQRLPSVTDLVYEHLYNQVVGLELPPGAKLSEVEVARQLGVSRQPVRDAFYRLSQQGFLLIRPQRATLVTHISEEAVMQAHFIRTALEMATVQAAADAISADDGEALDQLLEEQKLALAAGDKLRFHELDDNFHKLISEISGHGYAWSLIRDHKAHMDRVRYLSLSFGAQAAIDEHAFIVSAIKAGNGTAAVEAMRDHLSRIGTIVERIHLSHPAFFEMDEK